MASFSVVNLGSVNPMNFVKRSMDSVQRTIEANKAKIIEAARIAKEKIETEKRLELEAQAQAQAQVQAEAEALAQAEASKKKANFMKLAAAGVAAYFLFK